ncbi:MAG TPA: methionyl-tRNA formyltransferase [Anaerolineae bacterium]|nr:methionyl-tRNA formyltransferase [Anaerolineae bacterium]
MADVVFMGTPSFAVPSLRALAAHHRVVGVVTQPDRRAGRGRRLVLPPVKEAALELGLPVFQPPTLRTAEAVQRLAAWQPEVIVVAAFGQILRPPVLELPPHGCLNVHASLLPRWRGASPVAAAILAGETVTGVSLMLMDEGMDSGPILAQWACPIAPEDTTGTLTGRLAEMGAQLLIETLPGWLEGGVQAQPQDDEQATYCRLLRKEDGRLDWSRPAAYLERQVRACDPWPGAFTTWQGRRLKVLRARLRPEVQAKGPPGRVVDLSPGLGVVAGQGVLELVEVQLAGKKPLPAEAFARGQKRLIGSVLGG